MQYGMKEFIYLCLCILPLYGIKSFLGQAVIYVYAIYIMYIYLHSIPKDQNFNGEVA